MNAELLAVLDQFEKERGIKREDLMAAVNEAVVTAAKKAVGPARDLRCETDPKTGEIRAFAKLIVVDRVKSEHDEISRFDAMQIKDDARPGDEIEKEVTPAGFGRIAAQHAKQALLQQMRRAEKAMIWDEFKDRTGDIVSGTVRGFERSDVKLDLGKFEALLPNRERVPIEEYQVGERLRCFVKAVEDGPNGPEIILSRADPQFVIKLFNNEVSEIADGTVEVIAIAREPGFRTKLAVHSRDNRVDPVGACVGLRGQRVKNIVRELNNEKVDIIKWDSDIQTYVTNCLAPAVLKDFEIDEANKRVRILVSEDQLSLAIGKRGQNARLTSKLSGWQIDIDAEEVETVSFDDQVAQAIAAIAAVPGISEEQATTLVNCGFHTFEDLRQAEVDDLAGMPGLEESAQALHEAVQAETTRRENGETPAEAEQAEPQPDETPESEEESAEPAPASGEDEEEATEQATTPDEESAEDSKESMGEPTPST
ncbi:MAG: transcription termination/antitermination protein NusA [Verrucomicrobiales bacterium]|nr:transcription termination/antitermination protein NusA [Verrucomicrobiales bacterium]|tara:strand:- start:64733 stop:66178 length:1446 start_codon:yes stop_codon:yes gene_type:complete